MDTPFFEHGSVQAASLPSASGLRYVARQPITDLRGRVHGYELLFRNGTEEVFRGDGDLATRTMLDNTVLFGLERLTSGLSAFVNCTSESLTENLVRVLPPGITVLEILENLEPTPRLIQACRQLKSAGFRIALDDFFWKPGIEPLVEIADYIKVDFGQAGAAERKALLQRLGNVTVALVAEKVETQENYTQARNEGFSFFQGFYFCRPILLRGAKIPANRLSSIEILQLLREEALDLNKLTHLVKRDASLTYRLLRLVNSPICAIRREVRSIHSALLAVGEDTFRRIATLAITSELGAGQPPEVLHMAFLRGRFCELAAPGAGLDRTEQYLLGLLSLLPAMLHLRMEELTPSLALRDEIRLALNGKDVPERALLAWLEHHERANWEACDFLVQTRGLNQRNLLLWYADAVAWAEAAIRYSA